jgi:hypothetical protein
VRRHAISDQAALVASTSASKAGATPARIPSLFEIAFLLGRESRFRLHFKKPSEASVFADVFDGTLLDSDAADNLAVWADGARFYACRVYAYRFGFSVDLMTRLTRDGGTWNVRAIAAGFSPALKDARMRFAFPSGSSSTVLTVFWIAADRGTAEDTSLCGRCWARRSISAVTATRSFWRSALSRYLSEVERSDGSMTRGGTVASVDDNAARPDERLGTAVVNGSLRIREIESDDGG